MMSKTFAHLHNHSEYSLLDGAQTTADMAKKGAELGLSALSLTDHGRMGGLVEFYSNCKKYGVKPILGMEAYITGIGRSRTDRIDWHRKTKEFIGTPRYERSNYHLILLAKNEQGYDNLCQLSTESYSTGFYQKPRIDYDILEKYKDGLIVSSACVVGELSSLLLNHNYKKAREVALWFKKTFGDDYYIEIMNHHLAIEEAVMQPIRELADELDIKIIATNDDHYTNKEDHKLQKTLMLLGMHKSWADSDVYGSYFGNDVDERGQRAVSDDNGDSDPIFETPPELYMKNYDEMLEVLLSNGGEGGVAERELDNTNEIAEKCNFDLPIIDPDDTDAYFLADYPIKEDSQYDEYEKSGYEIPQYIKDACVDEMQKLGHDDVHDPSDFMSQHEIEALRFLMYICEGGIERLIKPKVEALGEPLPSSYWIKNEPEGFELRHSHNSPDEVWIKQQVSDGKSAEDIINIYRDRLAYETSVICAKKFVNYFLIVQSYVNFTREQKAAIGPGRGSAAGCLLMYLAGITAVDPIPNGLMFERFLNPDRRGYPDCDLDFGGYFRDNVLWPHIRDMYGRDNTSAVAAYTYYWGKAAIKAAARVLFDCSNDNSFPEQLRKDGKDTSDRLANAMADLIDNKPKLDLNTELDGSNEALTNLIKTDVRYQQIIELALTLQGRISGEGQHASAYIVSPHPITNRMPLMVSKDERERSQKNGVPVDTYLIQYDGRTTQDKLGYVKLDLLCINDLEVITTALNIIQRIYGCTIDIENIPLDDTAAFELVREGHNTGLFQFDGSPVAGRLLVDCDADCIGDWSAVNALNRPGSLIAGFDKKFVEGKRHKDQVTYFTPAAEKYLGDTYGAVCVAEGTPVLTDNGYKSIEDIEIGDNVLTDDGTFHQVTRLIDNGVKDTVRLHTDFGEDLVCTPDHKVLTADDGWVEVQNLDRDMLIKSFNPYRATGSIREIEPFDWYDWFIGLFIADGNSGAASPTIACCSEEFADKLITVGKKLFPSMEHIHKRWNSNGANGITWYVVFSEKQGRTNGSFSSDFRRNSVSTLLKKYGLFHATKDAKKWPSHDQFSFSTIIGMWEGDGCYINKRLHVKYRHIAYGVYDALLLYGFHASIYQDTSGAWLVSVDNIDALQPKLREFTHAHRLMLSHIPSRYLERLKYHLMPDSDRRRINQCIRHKTIRLNRAKDTYGWTPNEDDHLDWAHILSIKPDGKHHVYDLTVDERHSYVASCLVAHNCFQEQVMLLSQDKQIVGFTGGESDTMRKILAHKDKDKIQWIVDLAHERAAENHVPKDVVDKFCDIAVAAGSYSFNRCCTGDTLLHRANACHRDKNYPEPDIPIEEVYRRFNASAARNSPDQPIRSKYRSKRPDRGLFIMCRDADGRARKHKVKNVYQQGVRSVYKVTLENGKSIKVTENHRLQARDCYKRVDELIVGEDELWCCDFTYDNKPVRKYNFSDVTEEHRGARGIGKHMSGDRCGENNAMYTNGGWTKFKQYKATHAHCEIDGCDKCAENGDRIEIHHIDGDRTNNEDSNLQALCVSHHKQVHFDNGRRKHGEKGYETYLSKVVSIEYAGEEMTYDVEMDSEEHNFFANGISSHNSHSLAYAIIAYRGAFLKAHFPEAFLAAMCQLKPDQKGKNKIPDYLEDARQLGVEVLPPHVNYSLVAFDVPRKGAIAYGLERIKGVGKSAQPIVDERKKNGPYTDFTDFCCRVPREVGKSALLPLIRYGALDGLGWSRKAMIESIDDVIAFRKKWFDEQERRQSIETNIFDMFSLPTVPPATTASDVSTAASATDSASPTSPTSPAATRPYERTVELVAPFDDEYTERELLRQQKETLGMCLSGSFEDYSQLNRFRIEREMRETYARKVKTGSYNSKYDPLPIMVADVPRLPNQRLVEMMCVVSDPEGKNRDNPRMFRSGKGCSIFVYDHGTNEESRFGFSPRRYATKLTVFSRTWDSLPVFPRPGDVLHIIGRISIDADSNFPPAVIVDQLDVIDEDSALFGKMSRDELMQLQKDFNEYKRHVSDPNDDRYLIPVLEFETKEDMDEFLDAPGTQKYMGDGRVQVISDDETSTLKKIVNLKQTRGMVKWAAGFGAKAYKTRLPKAQSAIDRAKLMKSDDASGSGESGDGGGADTDA